MEVDPPAGPSGVMGSGSLKRSNSAPMINALPLSTPTHPDENASSEFRSIETGRIRRFSSSNMSLNTAVHSPGGSGRCPDRIHQIKSEESHITDRENARERDVRSAMQMSNSWEGFNLDETEHMNSEAYHRRPRSFSESLHIWTSSNMLCGSPSPTRVGKQCFSPSMQIPVKNTTFTPSPSPSPTRKSFVRSASVLRSLSPIAVGPRKRKLETDSGEYISPAKKFNTGPSTPDKIIAHPLAHSVSSSSLEESSSPEQQVPQAEGRMGDHRLHKPESYAFRPVRADTDIHMADGSESSDMTDMSYFPCPSTTSSSNLFSVPSTLAHAMANPNPFSYPSASSHHPHHPHHHPQHHLGGHHDPFPHPGSVPHRPSEVRHSFSHPTSSPHRTGNASSPFTHPSSSGLSFSTTGSAFPHTTTASNPFSIPPVTSHPTSPPTGQFPVSSHHSDPSQSGFLPIKQTHV